MDQFIFWSGAKAVANEVGKMAGRNLTQRALTALGKNPRQRVLAEVLQETYAAIGSGVDRGRAASAHPGAETAGTRASAAAAGLATRARRRRSLTSGALIVGLPELEAIDMTSS